MKKTKCQLVEDILCYQTPLTAKDFEEITYYLIGRTLNTVKDNEIRAGFEKSFSHWQR